MRTNLCLLLFIFCACLSSKQEDNLPKSSFEGKMETSDYIFVAKEDSVKTEPLDIIENPLLDTSYTVLDSKIGDINLDAYPDKVVILKSKSEGIATNLPRPLLLFVGQPDKSFKLQARNNSVVLTADDGGVHGDPYGAIMIKKGYFSIEHYGGSAWRWTRIITFKYSNKENAWYLHRDAGLSFHLDNPDKKEDIINHKEDFGKVLFEKYRNNK
jgi:hypothetical protein